MFLNILTNKRLARMPLGAPRNHRDFTVNASDFNALLPHNTLIILRHLRAITDKEQHKPD
jgi:hypothetical protein